MSEVFKVELDFQDGNGWYDITSITRAKEFYRERHLYNNLAPTTDICRFKIQYNQVVLSRLLLAQDDIKVRIRKGAGLEDYFYGFVNPNYKIRSSTRVEWVEIRLVDNSFLLEKPITDTLQYSGDYLADYTDTDNSLVHKLMVAADFSLSNVGNITAYEVDGLTKIQLSYFTHLPTQPDSDNRALSQIPYGGTYKEILTNILFQYGFTYYFDASGKLQLFDFKNTNVDPGSSTIDNSNMIGRLDFQKKEPRYEAAEISWQEEETIEDVILFRDTNGTENSIYPDGNILVEAGEFYPANATDSFVPEGYWNPVFDDGRDSDDIIAVYNTTLDTEYYGEDVSTSETKTRIVEQTYTEQVNNFDWVNTDTYYECHDPLKSAVTAIKGLILSGIKYQDITYVSGCWTGCFNYSVWEPISGTWPNRTWGWVTHTACPIPGFKFRFDTYTYQIVSYTTVEHTEGVEEEYDETTETYYEPGYIETYEELPLSFKYRIKNTGTHDLYIRKLQITGDVRLKSLPSITKDERSGTTEKVFKYDASYIHSLEESQDLANAIYDYFNNSTYSYQVQSNTLYDPGDWVLLTDDNFQNVGGFPVEDKRCLVVSRKDEEFTGTYTYILEEYADYASP